MNRWRGAATGTEHHSPRLQRWLFAALVSLTAIFVADAIAVLIAAQASSVNRRIVLTRFDPARLQADTLLAALVNEESGARGYQLTRDPEFLQPYLDGMSTERSAAAELRAELAGQRNALLLLDHAERAIAAWHGAAERAVTEVGATTRIASARTRAEALMSKQLFDTVRSSLSSLTAAVWTLQSQATTRATAATMWLVQVIVASLIAATLVVVAAGWFARRALTVPLAELMGDIRRVREGDLDAAVVGRGSAELVQIAESVDAMRRSMLEHAKETFDQTLVLAVDEQRRRLAAEIHDDPTQSLTALSLRLQRLRRHLGGSEAEMLADAEAATAAALDRLRHLIFELHPPTLDEDGLTAAIQAYTAQVFDSASTVVSVTSSGDDGVHISVRGLAYRLARGAILNVAEHADARHVAVHVEHAAGRLSVEVTDDGRGFDIADLAEPKPGHLGLSASERLARGAGGGYVVTSARGSGTTVRFWLPDV